MGLREHRRGAARLRPVAAVYLALLVPWDLCYRIGTGWWAAVGGSWRSARYRFDADTAAALRRVDREALLFDSCGSSWFRSRTNGRSCS